MKKALLTNPINGVSVKVYATTNNPASSYGRPVWVDSGGTAYCEVDSPSLYNVTEKSVVASYIYKGELGFLMYEQDGKKALGNCGDQYFYPMSEFTDEELVELTSEDVCVTLEDCYGGCADDEPEITDTAVVNPENEQRLIYAWVGIEYAKDNEIERKLLTLTDRYYDWTSERKKMFDKIFDYKEKGYDLSELEFEWKNIVSGYGIEPTDVNYSWANLMDEYSRKF